MGIFDRLKDGFDMSDIPGIISDLQKDGGVDLKLLKKLNNFGYIKRNLFYVVFFLHLQVPSSFFPIRFFL